MTSVKENKIKKSKIDVFEYIHSLREQSGAHRTKRTISSEEIKVVLPFNSQIRFLKSIQDIIKLKKQDVGFCVIFIGQNGFFKSTFSKILARASNNNFEIWSGSRWQKKILANLIH